ncbi:MAG: DUF1707 domain-containing protein [Actinobacteria bacterium]|nr:DUF1707 domain-containing protein [Actinomycetota bacterium]
MAEPEGETAGAGGYRRLRASHADREQAIDTLKAAFVQGQLVKDEFAARIGRVLASRTYADLTALTADLSAGSAEVPPAGTHAGVRPRRPVSNGIKWGAYGFITPAILAVSAAIALTGFDAIGAMGLTFAFLYFVLWMFVGGDIFAQWRRKRSRRKLPPRPAAGLGGQASQPSGSAA